MELLSVILVAVWLVGILLTAFSVVYTFKHDNGPVTQQFRTVMDVNPVVVTAFLAVLIIAWPATLAYSLATKRK